MDRIAYPIRQFLHFHLDRNKSTSYYVVTFRRKISGDRFRQMKMSAFKLHTPWLGLRYTFEKQLDGVVITEVTQGSPCAAAGLLAGDIIIAVDGLLIRETSDVTILVTTKIPGDSISLTILRDGKVIDFSIVLAANSDG